ncbi:MAG TPA: UDP-N-acetylmuramoyl-tripeptide--D-alanyl-D-alanine ligase [Bryobacteraceae bacterium]|nr:UDP-N-acetylmuramoyl-tripeptide--D-alanyl-D-alanine ligase [Bryobacteraceae bacterium]
MSIAALVMGAAEVDQEEITGYSVDSRTVQSGDLFFALRGEHFDGHDFLSAAFSRGAAGAVIDRDVAAPGRTLRVPDTLQALQQFASWARNDWDGSVVGVTGSAGKTTTKDVIAAMLATGFKVGKTVGNFNNHVGLPLSILRLPEDSEVAVIELGMNHAQEIRSLAAIAQPDIGVVTNVGSAHIENFESIDGIAAAKRELIEALPEDGTAVLNADDERVRTFAHAFSGESLTFGLSAEADIRAEEVVLRETGVRFRVGETQFESPLAGRHGIRNILAGIAVAHVFGVPFDTMSEVARTLSPGKMRGERLIHKGIKIFNDCYNSNPDAAKGMIDVLGDTPARRHIAVLGEMLELGRWSETLHRDVGRYVAESGTTVLVGIRGAARFMVDAAMAAGPDTAAYFFENPTEAGIFLRSLAQAGDAILFKGSRGTRVEMALERFLE